MATIGRLEAVFAHLVEVEAPAIDSLPENTDSADWLRAQDFATARVSPTGNVVGLAKAGVPEPLTFATAVRATDPRYARGTRSIRSVSGFSPKSWPSREAGQVDRSNRPKSRPSAGGAVAPSGRSVSIVEPDGDHPDTTWLSTPDYRRVAQFKKSPRDIKPSVFVARMAGGTGLAEVSRTGRGKANWPTATPT